MSEVPDRIEKQIVLRAPLARVWKAITDSREFGAWFGATFNQPFVAGQKIVGKIAPTTADPEVAKMQEPYAGMDLEFMIERMETERLFSFRWHPGAIDPALDYSKEPTTLVEFTLEPVADGVRLTIVESGFEGIPLSRRAESFRMNEGGWEHQARLIEKYLAEKS